MPSTTTQLKSKLRYIAVCVVALIFLGILWYVFFSPQANTSRSIFQDLSAHDIQYVTIEPARYASLVSQPVVIRDRQMIKAIATALTGLHVGFANHPNITKAVVVRIQLQGKAIGGELQYTSNDGVWFEYMSNISKGWIFAMYRVPQNRHIFHLIETALAGASAPNNSIQRTRYARR